MSIKTPIPGFNNDIYAWKLDRSGTLISVRPIGRTGQERRAPAPGDARDVIAGASTPTAVNGSDSGGTPMRWRTKVASQTERKRGGESAHGLDHLPSGGGREREREKERKRERYVESEVYITEVYIHSSRSETRRRREGGFSIRRWKRNNTWPITYIKVENDRAQTQSSLSALGGHCALAKVITIFFSPFSSPPHPSFNKIIDEFLRVARKGSCGNQENTKSTYHAGYTTITHARNRNNEDVLRDSRHSDRRYVPIMK